jgi:SAM-dependent methyltransferase
MNKRTLEEQAIHRKTKTSKDYLWPHLRDLPYFRAILRAVEARFYQDVELPAPVLDVGCGDGHFATIAFDKKLDVGLDPWSGPIHEAAGRGAYRLLTQADGGRMPFPDQFFASAISNSVLEHIPHVEAVLLETARVLKPGAPFTFCVPNHNFLPTLSIGRSLDRLGLRSLANRYRAFFNRISRHHHCDPPEVWQPRLEKAGFQIERWWHYFPPHALHVLEWGHYFGLPSLLSKRLTGYWILAPTQWNLALTRQIVLDLYEEDPVCENGVYSFYITRRCE